VHGQLVKEIVVEQASTTQQFSTADLRNGIYYLNVTDDKNQILFTEKVMIMK